jgi:hypothetical protein
MKKSIALLMCLVLSLMSFCLAQGKTDKQIIFLLKHGAENELAVQHQLERLLMEYDLDKWIFTDTVQVVNDERSHSHPVLTISKKTLGDDLGMLSVFVHEQIHWPLHEDSTATDAAIAELRTIFPKVPVGGAEGARSEASTYLHLLVCYLEYEAMAELIGAEITRDLMSSFQQYRWIYRTVLEHGDRIKTVILKNNLHPNQRIDG